MRSQFDHENLRVYQAAIEFVAWVEEVAASVAIKVSSGEHLARASASVPVNIAEATGKRSMRDRHQFIDTAYGSSLECAACLDVLYILGGLAPAFVEHGKSRLAAIVSMLIGFRKATRLEVREEDAGYDNDSSNLSRVWFDHERLDVYRKSLAFVGWCSQLRVAGSARQALGSSLDRTSTSVVLNIAEGNGKFSVKDRCRFIGHARTAAVQAAATLDVLAVRHVQCKDSVWHGKGLLVDLVRMLVAWERSLEGVAGLAGENRTRTPTRTRESPASAAEGTPWQNPGNGGVTP